MNATSSSVGPMEQPFSVPASEPLGVIINYQCWLPLTENWIYTQARHLPPSVIPYIACGSTQNLDQFAIDRLHSFGDQGGPERLRLLARGALRLGLHLRRRSAMMAEIQRRHAPKVVHSHFGYTGYQYAKAVRKLGLAHVVTFYGVDMSALPRGDKRWLARYRRMFREVDRVLCEGPHMAERIRELGCPDEKLQVQRLGVDLGAIPFRPRRLDPREPLRILMAASFREKKGFQYGIAAVGEVAKRFPVELTIIGDAGANPKSIREKRRIREALERAELNESVRMLGYQTHRVLLEEAYRHHVFLSPSITASDGDTEGGAPITLIEMAATGMPVLSTRHADIPEVVVDGETGFLVDEKDTEALANRLQWLRDYPDTWQGIAYSAQAHVAERFDASLQGARLAAIYAAIA